MVGNKISRIIKWLPVVNTGLFVLGGVLGYILVQRYLVAESLSNTKLADVQVSIGNIELELKRVRALMDLKERQLKVSIDASNIISELQPSISLNVSEATYKDGVIRIIASIRNLGRHTVFLRKPSVSVIATGNGIFSKAGTVLTEGTGYTLIAAEEIGLIPPGENRLTTRVEIQLAQATMPPNVTVDMQFQAEILAEVRTVAERFLEGILTAADIDRLSRRYYNRHIELSKR